jgi:hypothetical protein
MEARLGTLARLGETPWRLQGVQQGGAIALPMPMLEQGRGVRPNKRRNPVGQRRGQGCRREHRAPRILLQQSRLLTDPEGDERPVRLVQTLHVAPGHLPPPQHSPIAQPEANPHIASQIGG